MMKKTLLCAFALFAFMVSCKKYDDGPAFSLRSKTARLARTWTVDKYLIDNVDSTKYYAAQGTFLKLEKKGGATATVRESDGVQSKKIEYTGYWEWHENKRAIALILTDSAETDTTGFWIKRLTAKELWLEDADDKEQLKEWWLVSE